MLAPVDPQRYARVKEIYLSAWRLSPAEWPAYLDSACRDEPELRGEVEALLAARSGGLASGPDAATGETRRFEGSEQSVGAGRLTRGYLLDGLYMIESEIGSGGMGSVYRARQLALDRSVAVKVISAGPHAPPSALQRFAREAITVARLRHPNIVTVFDSGAVPEVGAYIVMELLEGSSLADRIAACGRLSLNETVALMRQVCSAVEAAHDAGVIHRDLKPHNVVLERGEPVRAKVLDFGIAKSVDVHEVSITAPGVLVGTPIYMSPEQCQGLELDARSDVYSLGCVLYEMLTGQPPFFGGSVVSIALKHITEQPIAPGALAPDLGPDVDAVVMKALAKSAARRFASAGGLATALAACRRSASDGSRDAHDARVRRGGATLEEAAPDSAEATVAATASAQNAVTETGRVSTDDLQGNLTRLVGRDGDVREAEARLMDARLVTLVGPGGIGKTRLARAVAHSSRRRFPDGVLFVALPHISDPALVASEVAKTADVKEVAGRSLTEELCREFAGRQLLLVLDNCEHVVEACARLAQQLLRSSAETRILASSREVLGVAGEAVFTVPALESPPPGASSDPDAVARHAAVQLFVDRARLVRHDFAVSPANAPVLAELSRRLEGIPLAIELAAARLRVLSLDQILKKMGDRLKLLAGRGRAGHERQRTLRATIQWSYELLGAAEQRVFATLSVFAGGARLEAIEAVCEENDVLGTVTSLVDKSLLVQRDQPDSEPRLGMLEVVREYAGERLRETGSASEVERRHAGYYLGLAERSESELWSPRAAQCMELLEQEHANVRASLEWSLRHEPGRCLRAVAAIYPFWAIRGHLTEGRRWLKAALDTETEPVSAVRAKALRGVGWIARLQRDYAPARLAYEESLRICREMGDIRLAAMASRGLGLVALDQADFREACRHLDEVLTSGRVLGSDDLIIYALLGLGEVARAEDDMALARRLYEEALPLARQQGDFKSLGAILGNIGMIACDAGDLHAAGAHFLESFTIDRALGDKAGVATAFNGIAAVAARSGAWVRAARLLGVAESLRGESEGGMDPVDRAFRERYVALVRAQLGDPAFEEAAAEGRSLELGQEVDLLDLCSDA
jgi:predicted ATPase/serine/threonine protein kinase